MIKVKMVSRHTAESGEKLERGLSYLLPRSYAQELIDHGLAIPVVPETPPVNVTQKPTKTIIMATALRKMRAEKQEPIKIEPEIKNPEPEDKEKLEAENGTEESARVKTED